MLTLTGENNLLHHLPTADNRIGFTTDQILEPPCQTPTSPAVLVGVSDLLEASREKLVGTAPPSVTFAGVLLRKGNKLVEKHHGVMPWSRYMDFRTPSHMLQQGLHLKRPSTAIQAISQAKSHQSSRLAVVLRNSPLQEQGKFKASCRMQPTFLQGHPNE